MLHLHLAEDGAKYKGLSDAFLTILRTEGPLAFWTGFGAYYMRTAPHAMIILMSTEPIVAAYRASLGLEKK
jgi:solute carrier family 25 oxoglutarate transporter 11